MSRQMVLNRRPVSTAARVLAEKWYAWRTSHEMLRWYQRVSGEEPHLTRTTLYREIVVRRLELDIGAARDLLQRVRQSFCEWPHQRELRFRDVVNYLVVDEYMQGNVTNVGMYTDTRRIVSGIIPSHL